MARRRAKRAPSPFAGSPSTRLPSARCRRRSSTRVTSIAIWWMRSRLVASSTGLVGYQVSPLLWDKVRRGISAGRVQTVALRLIVEREREIKAFVKEEYWTIDAASAGRQTAGFCGAVHRHRRRKNSGNERLKMPPRSRLPSRPPTGAFARLTSASAAAVQQRRLPPASSSRTLRASCVSA